jgi:hypothetical protein
MARTPVGLRSESTGADARIFQLEPAASGVSSVHCAIPPDQIDKTDPPPDSDNHGLEPYPFVVVFTTPLFFVAKSNVRRVAFCDGCDRNIEGATGRPSTTQTSSVRDDSSKSAISSEAMR